MRNIKPKTQSKSFKSRFAHEGPLSQSLKICNRREDPCHQEQALDCMELTISQLSNPDRNILSGSQGKRQAYRCAGGVCEGQQFGWHPVRGIPEGVQPRKAKLKEEQRADWMVAGLKKVLGKIPLWAAILAGARPDSPLRRHGKGPH